MKGIFLYASEIDYDNLTGIDKKVLSQVNTLNDNGIKCKLVTLGKKKVNNIQKLKYAFYHRIPFGEVNLQWPDNIRWEDLDFVYYRRPTFIYQKFLNYLMNIKKKNSKIKIIMEIPTFPYDGELKNRIIDLPLLYKDRINRNKLINIVDRIAVQGDIHEIFGIPTLNFTNGIRIQDYSIRENRNLTGINICAVASLEPWQGYERVILGLAKYYKEGGKRDIHINIVGMGIEEKFYKELVKENNLLKNINFTGFLSGDALEDIYSNSDIALDAFGRYKTGNGISTSLKSREYLAKGLPIVSGSEIDILDSSSSFYLEFPSDNSVINFNRIVEFFDQIYSGKSSKNVMIQEIRTYAYEVCDMSKTMKDIIGYLKN